jgi:hypothetical protein
MITPILQRVPGANLGDPIREPEIAWRDLVGVRGRAMRRTWRARAVHLDLSSGKGLRPYRFGSAPLPKTNRAACAWSAVCCAVAGCHLNWRCIVLLNTRSGNFRGLGLVQAAAVFTQRFVKFPSISDRREPIRARVLEWHWQSHKTAAAHGME